MTQSCPLKIPLFFAGTLRYVQQLAQEYRDLVQPPLEFILELKDEGLACDFGGQEDATDASPLVVDSWPIT